MSGDRRDQAAGAAGPEVAARNDDRLPSLNADEQREPMMDESSMDGPPEVTVDEYLRRRPSEAASVRAAIAPYRKMTSEERYEAFRRLLQEMDALLDGPPRRTRDEEEFWRHWKDPFYGKAPRTS